MCDCLSVSEVFGAVTSPLTPQGSLLEMFLFSPLFLVQSGVVLVFEESLRELLRVGVQASFLSASFFAHGGHCEVCEVVTEDVTPPDPGGVFAHLWIFGLAPGLLDHCLSAPGASSLLFLFLDFIASNTQAILKTIESIRSKLFPCQCEPQEGGALGAE